MLFERYSEIMGRLEELGAQMRNLNNQDRQVMQNLLEEQEWLSATLVKRAKYLLEEIDRSFEQLFDWMINFSDLIERASGHGGTPADVLRMERMMHEADDLREQLNRLVPERGEGDNISFNFTSEPGEKGLVLESEQESLKRSAGYLSSVRREAAPANMQLEMPEESHLPVLIPVDSGINSIVPVGKTMTVVKKTKKKDRKKKKVGNNGHSQYQPPKELLSALEQKMATVCKTPKTGMESKKSSQ